MKTRLQRLMSRTLFCIVAMLSSSMASAADINCYAGSTVQDRADGFLKVVGIFPESVLNARVAVAMKSAQLSSAAISDLGDICTAVKGKDVIDVYFLALARFSAGLPMAPFMSYQINAGKAIVKQANQIAENVAYSGLLLNNGAATYFNVRVRRGACSRWWQQIGCDYYSSTEIDDLISEVTVLYRTDAGVSDETQPLWRCSNELCSNKNNGVTIYEIAVGEALLSIGGNIREAYVQIKWASGQTSVVPIRTGFVEASGNKFTLVFTKNDRWFEYSY